MCLGTSLVKILGLSGIILMKVIGKAGSGFYIEYTE